MDIVGQLKDVINLCDQLYFLYKEYKDLGEKYITILNDIIILKTFLINIEKNPRMPDHISECLGVIKEKLTRLYKKLRKYKEESKIKSLIYSRHRTINTINISLKQNIKRLELLQKMGDNLNENAKLDVANIISNHKGVEFWDLHFGKDRLELSFSLFIQAFEDKIIRFRPQEILIIKRILDSDNNNLVTAYEFNKWLERFGSVDNIVKRTLISLMDTKKGSVYNWFKENYYKNQSIKYLKDRDKFGDIVVRYHDHPGYFVIDYVGLEKNPTSSCKYINTFKSQKNKNKKSPKQSNIGDLCNFYIYEITIGICSDKFIVYKPKDMGDFNISLFDLLENKTCEYDYLSEIVKDFKQALKRMIIIFNINECCDGYYNNDKSDDLSGSGNSIDADVDMLPKTVEDNKQTNVLGKIRMDYFGWVKSDKQNNNYVMKKIKISDNDISQSESHNVKNENNKIQNLNDIDHLDNLYVF